MKINVSIDFQSEDEMATFYAQSHGILHTVTVPE